MDNYCAPFRLTMLLFKISAVGWEVWITYGLVGGDSVDLRRPEILNKMIPRDINWLVNSLGDGSICIVAVPLIHMGSYLIY